MIYSRLLDIDHSSRQSFFLFGPRGVGKTVWIKKHFSNCLYFDLLDLETYGELLADPKIIAHSISEHFNDWIIIDEIQKIPQLLNEVHRLIENRGIRFGLTGSSARSLRRKGVNLLAGRALRYAMHPLTAIELGDDFDLMFALEYGMLPFVYSASQPKHYLKTYVQTYLREEVLQEGLTRDLHAFSRFLEIASFSQGNILNKAAIAREVGINEKTIAGYFEILEDLLLATHVPVFTKKAKRQLVSHSKFYYFDVGVYRALKPKGPLDENQKQQGVALETLFFQNLRAINDYYQLDNQLYFWRTRYGVEVDFIVYGEKGLFAFEIKMSKRIHTSDLNPLKTFCDDYPMAELYLIYLGESVRYYNSITVLPIIDALYRLPEILKVENPA